MNPLVRIVQPELLDSLPPDDSRAVKSRHDLRRINWFMRNGSLVAGTLAGVLKSRPILRLAEMGAGDGDFLAGVLGRLPTPSSPVEVTLVDSQARLSPATLAKFRALRWPARMENADARLWAGSAATPFQDVIICNLFLHHFEEPTLRELLHLTARKTNLFIALEPRRTRPALFFSRFVCLLGCSRVTQHDAVVSVRAGFMNRELSSLWPQSGEWDVAESEANLTSHLFIARRKVPLPVTKLPRDAEHRAKPESQVCR